jgi:hypothetical protein
MVVRWYSASKERYMPPLDVILKWHLAWGEGDLYAYAFIDDEQTCGTATNLLIKEKETLHTLHKQTLHRMHLAD